MNYKLRSKFMSILVIGAYLLSACGGTLPQSGSNDMAQKVLAKEFVFTGIIEAMNGNQWIVSGQAVTVDPSTALDPNIAVGVIVKVEGSVSDDGTVVALKIESSTADDDNSNDNNGNDNNTNDDGNANDDNSNDDNGNSNDDNGNDDNSNEANEVGNEVFGVVEAVTTESITVNGVVYQFASFTEIKNAIAVGDQVKIHVIVNVDGTFTIREIEKSDGLSNDDNGNDDNFNDDDGNDNSNDDDGDDDNGNDDNSNDDDGNDNDD